jgi:hypothetical protein
MKCIITAENAVRALGILGTSTAGRACEVQRLVPVVTCRPIVAHVVLYIELSLSKSSAATAHKSSMGPNNLSVVCCHHLSSGEPVWWNDLIVIAAEEVS